MARRASHPPNAGLRLPAGCEHRITELVTHKASSCSNSHSTFRHSHSVRGVDGYGVGPGVVIYHRLSLSDGIAARLLPNRSGTSGPLVTSVIYAFRLRHTRLMHAMRFRTHPHTDHTQYTYDTHIHIHTHTTRGHGDVDWSHTQSKHSL